MANINTILKTISSAIVADSDVDDFCSTQYDKTLTVYVNCDARQQPPGDAFPLVIVLPMGKHGGLGSKQKEHFIGIVTGVYDERHGIEDDGVEWFMGGKNAEILRQLVMGAVIAADLPNLKLMDLYDDHETIEQFPYVSITSVLEFHETWTIGSSPFE